MTTMTDLLAGDKDLKDRWIYAPDTFPERSTHQDKTKDGFVAERVMDVSKMVSMKLGDNGKEEVTDEIIKLKLWAPESWAGRSRTIELDPLDIIEEAPTPEHRRPVIYNGAYLFFPLGVMAAVLFLGVVLVPWVLGVQLISEPAGTIGRALIVIFIVMAIYSLLKGTYLSAGGRVDETRDRD